MSLFFPFDSLVRFDGNEDLFSPAVGTNRRGKPKSNISQSRPRMDLIDHKDRLTAIVELPGLTKDKIDISLHDNVLTISGTVEHSSESKVEGSTYAFAERSYGSFARSIAVPPGLKENEIKASLEDGLLKVDIPKAAKQSEAKKITIA